MLGLWVTKISCLPPLALRRLPDDGVIDVGVVEIVLGLVDQQRPLALEKQDGQDHRAALAGREPGRVLVGLAVLELDQGFVGELHSLESEGVVAVPEMIDDALGLVLADAGALREMLRVAPAEDRRQFLRRQVGGDLRDDLRVLHTRALERIPQVPLVRRAIAGLGDRDPNGGRECCDPTGAGPRRCRVREPRESMFTA